MAEAFVQLSPSYIMSPMPTDQGSPELPSVVFIRLGNRKFERRGGALPFISSRTLSSEDFLIRD